MGKGWNTAFFSEQGEGQVTLFGTGVESSLWNVLLKEPNTHTQDSAFGDRTFRLHLRFETKKIEI